MAKTRVIRKKYVDHLEYEGQPFRKGYYFGVKGESKFYRIKLIESDGSLVLDIYKVGKDGSYLDSEDRDGYNVSAFKYRIEINDLFHAYLPVIPLVSNKKKVKSELF